jgi:molecular chaperone DnaK (HSP70)
MDNIEYNAPNEITVNAATAYVKLSNQTRTTIDLPSKKKTKSYRLYADDAEQLRLACLNKDVEMVEKLLRSNVKTRLPSDFGNTLLRKTLKIMSSDIAELLLIIKKQ